MKTYLPSLLALSISSGVMAAENLPEVNVTADFRDAKAIDLPFSLSVISETQIEQRAAQHLESILTTVPNVNSAAGASRGRFFQIRGIGERSQYKEPLDSSVGLVVDGIDFSNLGLAGSLADVRQIEVLRGPQGTRFGSSAMAGMINIKTNDPTEEFEGNISATLGNYNTANIGALLSGPINETLLGRLALQTHRGDGYMVNDFLNRDDTNNFDEQSMRGKLTWLATEELTINLTLNYLNVDNGYDAFSLDHNRHTRSDQPGYDRQESTAVAIETVWQGFESYTVTALITAEDTNLDYGFEWDWSDWDSVGVRGFESNQRDRKASSLDLRLTSKPGHEILGGASWVSGLYVYDRSVDLDYFEDADYYGAWTGALQSQFDSRRYAAYGQLEWPLSERFNVSLGVRAERFENDYTDSYGVDGDIGDNLWGGSLALEYLATDNTMLYASFSRGYKTGGINTDAIGKALVSMDTATIAKLDQHFDYDAELLYNYEIGLKGSYLDNTLQLNLATFYMDRHDMQAKVALEISTANWTSYRDNISGSDNYGVELEANWQAADTLNLFASLGLLESELGNLIIIDVDSGLPVNQSGRDQAHAPGYQYNIGATLQLVDDLAFTIQADGKDKFYFSNSHDQKSESITLIHADLRYQKDSITVSLWGRNLTNEDVQVRGFYWANNPNNGWINESYTQLGEPRVVGVSGSYSF